MIQARKKPTLRFDCQSLYKATRQRVTMGGGIPIRRSSVEIISSIFLISSHAPSRLLRSTSANLLTIPQMKLGFTSRSLYVTLWCTFCLPGLPSWTMIWIGYSVLIYVDFKIILLLLCVPSAKAYRQKTLLHKIPVLN